MIFKGVKPRTQLKFDIVLFVLLMVIAISAVVTQIVSPTEMHIQLMFHRIHGWSGGLMYVMISVHLLLHFPWIRSQLSRWSKR